MLTVRLATSGGEVARDFWLPALAAESQIMLTRPEDAP
jgi:hypothetical protein